MTPTTIEKSSGNRPVLAESKHWFAAHPNLINWQHPLAIGFSGGADSTALLLALAAQHPALEAWHIDHGWHQDSAAQAQKLAQQCAQWGIVFRCRRVICSHTSNREHSARRARLQAFFELANSHHITQLALAHHREDQAETVLMRMLHGDGVRGCCGMAPHQQIEGIHLLRPLLSVSRSSIEQALSRKNVVWLQDPSNHDISLKRNHIRLHLMPAMTQALTLQANNTDATGLMLRWQQQATIVAEKVTRLSDTITIASHPNGVSIAWQPWFSQSAPVRAWTLQRMANALYGKGVCMGRRHINLIERWRLQGGHCGIDLSRCRLEHCKKRLWLMKTGQNMVDFAPNYYK